MVRAMVTTAVMLAAVMTAICLIMRTAMALVLKYGDYTYGAGGVDYCGKHIGSTVHRNATRCNSIDKT